MKNLTIYCLFFLIGASVYAQQEFYRFATKNPGATFIGAVIQADKINGDTHQFLDVAQKSITISFSLPIKSHKIIPSYNNMMSVVEDIIKSGDAPTQNVSFSHAIMEIKSYDELTFFFGQKINPTLLFGAPAKGDPKQNIVVVNLEQNLFSIDMDIPDESGFVIDNPEIDKDKLLYLSSVTFGRKAIALIESKQPISSIKEAINHVVQNYDAPDKIKESSHAVLANSFIRVMISGNNTAPVIHTENPLLDVLLYFKREITTSDFVSPITFTAAWLNDNSIFVNEVTL